MARIRAAEKGAIPGLLNQYLDPAWVLRCLVGVAMVSIAVGLGRWLRRGSSNLGYHGRHGNGNRHHAPDSKRKNIPLIPTPFRPLPIGTVKAQGWLATQLQMQVDGATGRAEELYTDLGPRSAWLGGDIDLGNWAEISPYYVKGLVALAYVTGNPALVAKAEKWVNWTLENTGRDGFLGPPMLERAGDGQDWWGRMPILYALRDYYDATHDDRVIPALVNWFRLVWQTAPDNPPTRWGRARIGDSIACVHWLYEQTHQHWLLDLSDYMEQAAYPWADIYTRNQFLCYEGGRDFQVKHNVNVQQCIKMPVIRSVRSNSEYHRASYRIGTDYTMRQHGQVHGGISGSEMLSGDSSTTGVELCAIVERMQADQEAQMILGEAHVGDHLEKLAFNVLPGSTSKDFTAHQYYTLPNQVQSIYGWHGCEQDNPTALTPSVASNFPCCRYDMHMGWPYYVKHMWATTPDCGLAALAYGPSHLTTRLGKERRLLVNVKADTNYPFEEQIRLKFTMPSQAEFPLILRIPAWAHEPSVMVNDVPQQNVAAGSFCRVDRTWSNGDQVTINFPMRIKTSRWVRQSVAVERGPLVYSLKIDESWLGPDPLINGETLGSGVNLLPGYGTWQVKPNSPWRYALQIDPANPEDSITVHHREMPQNPFVQSTTPVYLKARARALSYWGMLRSDPVLAAEPPYPAVTSGEDLAITLVPFGAENIRLTYFPLAIPTEITAQAEMATLSGGAAVGVDKGTAFVDLSGNTGASLELEVLAHKTGPHYLTLRYRQDCIDTWVGTKVAVNGSMLSKFKSGGAFDMQWADTEPQTVSMVAGTNTVVITANSTSAPKVHSVSIASLQGTCYQGEDAILSGAAIVNNDHPRYSGTGFVDFRRSTTAIATFNEVAAPADGDYKLVTRYSAGDMDPKGVRLIVNGVHQTPVTLPTTGSWGYWQDASLWVISLKSGTANTIEVLGSDPPFNLDSLAVVPLQC